MAQGLRRRRQAGCQSRSSPGPRPAAYQTAGPCAASLAAAAGNPPCGPAFPAGRTLPGRDPRAGPAAGRGPRTGWICGSGPDVALYVRRARAKKNSIRPLCSWMVRVYVRRARAKKEPRQKRGWWDKKLFIRDGVRPSPGLFSYKRRGGGILRTVRIAARPRPARPCAKRARAQSRPRAGPGRRLAPHCMFPDPPAFSGRRGFFRLAFVRGQFTLAAYFCRTLSICCVCAVSMGYQPFSDILL